MLGKTNMDEFAMGSSNETSFYGPCRNPWDPSRVPGGSSGGSASAVAARLAPFATGTDTGGSIRLPAAFCGVSGLKPTYGRVSRYGMIAFASSLDQGGPMALTAEDLALTLNAMCGFDPRDSTSAQVPAEDFTRDLSRPLAGLRIGLPREFFDDRLNPRIGTLLQQASAELERLGARCREVSLPSSAHAVPAYYIIASAECSSNLSRYDGVRFGYRCENPKDLQDLYRRSRAEGFGAEVKRRILVGTYALSTGYYDAYYAKAQKLRRLIKEDFQRVFTEVDLIAGPTAPGVAFALGEKTADPVDMYKKSRAEGFGAEVKRRILVGTYVLSHGYYDAYYLKAQQVRRLIADDFARAYQQCDVIMGPTAPSPAFKIGAKADDPVQMYLNDIFTIAGNLTGAPAISIPCGFDRRGLPIGLQIQGNYFGEAKLLNVAHMFQQATDWHARAPALAEISGPLSPEGKR